MSSDMEELAREGMRQFTATMQVSPDLAARTFERHRQRRRHVLRTGLALGAAGAVTAVAVITAVAHGPATKATPIAAPALRTRLLAAIDTASGDILYTPAPGAAAERGAVPGVSPAWPGGPCPCRPGRRLGREGVQRRGVLLHDALRERRGLHRTTPPTSTRAGCSFPGRPCGSITSSTSGVSAIRQFILGFTLDAAGIRAEIANGQFTVIGRTELHGQQAIELKINVPPNNEAPPHVTAERMWVNATTYLPMRGYLRMSNGQQSVWDYVFLPPTPENLAKLRPVIPAGYTRAACA